MSVLTEKIVLSLNANWQPLRWTSPQEALIAMSGGTYGHTPPALALDIELDDKGDLVSAMPCTLQDWLKLPVREGDLTLGTKDGAIRCPTVIVSPKYAEMPFRTPSLSNRAVLERDGFIDQYTGEKLTRQEASVDHVIPRDVWKRLKLKGSPDNFENMVACKKERNHRKGNKLNGALGLVLRRKPKSPKAVPVSFTIREIKRPEHRHFINHAIRKT